MLLACSQHVEAELIMRRLNNKVEGSHEVHKCKHHDSCVCVCVLRAVSCLWIPAATQLVRNTKAPD